MYDILIIGSGPAGLSAAIYASRGNLKTGIIECSAPGGKVINIDEIANYPGFAVINGFELGNNMFNHALSFGTEFISGQVINIISDGLIKKVVCEDNTYEAYAVVIATGTKSKLMGIPGEEQFFSRGVSYCAVCDGALFKDQPMAVIGGGNSALQEAIYLSRFASKIYLIHRRADFRAEKSFVEAIKKNPKIELVLNTIPVAILGDNKVHSIVIKNTLSKEERELTISVVFPYVGTIPISNFVQHLGVCDESGYIQVNSLMETSIRGLYAAGDVRATPLRQIATAVSDGAIAAYEAEKYIENIKKNNL